MLSSKRLASLMLLGLACSAQAQFSSISYRLEEGLYRLPGGDEIAPAREGSAAVNQLTWITTYSDGVNTATEGASLDPYDWNVRAGLGVFGTGSFGLHRKLTLETVANHAHGVVTVTATLPYTGSTWDNPLPGFEGSVKVENLTRGWVLVELHNVGYWDWVSVPQPHSQGDRYRLTIDFRYDGQTLPPEPHGYAAASVGISIVPEPSTALVLIPALAGLLVRRRRP